MPSEPEKLNGNTPATQHDLAILTGEMTSRFDKLDTHIEGLETRMDGLETRMDKLETGVGAILETVSSIDQQLKDWNHIPAKVERLHARIFGD